MFWFFDSLISLHGRAGRAQTLSVYNALILGSLKEKAKNEGVAVL